MLATPHAIAGAAIGKGLRRPWLALPAALASHFLLDWTPHLDTHALFGAATGGPTRAESLGALADTIVATALVLWAIRRQRLRRLMLASAFCAVAIDLIDNVPPWSAWFRAWPGTAWISAFHHGTQHNVTPAQWPLGFGVQILVVGVALWVILRPDRKVEVDCDEKREREETVCAGGR